MLAINWCVRVHRVTHSYFSSSMCVYILLWRCTQYFVHFVCNCYVNFTRCTFATLHICVCVCTLWWRGYWCLAIALWSHPNGSHFLLHSLTFSILLSLIPLLLLLLLHLQRSVLNCVSSVTAVASSDIIISIVARHHSLALTLFHPRLPAVGALERRQAWSAAKISAHPLHRKPLTGGAGEEESNRLETSSNWPSGNNNAPHNYI